MDLVAVERISEILCVKTEDEKTSLRMICDSTGMKLIRYSDQSCSRVESVADIDSFHHYSYSDSLVALSVRFQCYGKTPELGNLLQPGNWFVLPNDNIRTNSDLIQPFRAYREGFCFPPLNNKASFSLISSLSESSAPFSKACSSDTLYITLPDSNLHFISEPLPKTTEEIEERTSFVRRRLQSSNDTSNASNDDQDAYSHLHPPAIVFVVIVINIAVPIAFCLFCVYATRSHNTEDDEDSIIRKLLLFVGLM